MENKLFKLFKEQKKKSKKSDKDIRKIFEIALIDFDYHNSELIEWLQTRGALIREGNAEKIEKINKDMQKYFLDDLK